MAPGNFAPLITRIGIWFASRIDHRSPRLTCMTERTTGPDTFAFLPEGSELARLIRAFDWRKTALGELQRWPEHLRTVVALMLRSAVPMTLQWGQEGWMLYNDAYAVLAGSRHPELLGRTVRDSWSELAEFREHVLRQVLDGHTLKYQNEHVVLWRDGRHEDRWVDIDYSPVSDATGMPLGVLAIVKDVTERFQAAQRLSIAQEAGGVGIFELYPHSGQFEVSGAFRRIWGLDDDVPVTAALMNSLVHPDDRQTTVAQEMASTDQLAYREYRRLDSVTGETHWVAASGKAVSQDGLAPRFVGVAVDITERKRSEQALAESERRWRRLVEQMDIKQIRHGNVRLLVAQLGEEAERQGRRSGGMVVLAEMLGKSTSQVSRFAAEKPVTPIGNRIAREIEQVFEKEHGWLDHVQWPVE
jgi:PAS domain S-box-containing protein